MSGTSAFPLVLRSHIANSVLLRYNGIAPGPTLHMTKGREAVVRFINKYDRPSSIHLHGSYSRTPFDGWAEDVTNPGQSKDYYYPNAQPTRTLWYHDHAIGITAVNAYFGQAGFYILHDQAVEDKLQLPQGKYDVPLMLAAKQFQANGKLVSPELERVSLYGDVITVSAYSFLGHYVDIYLHLQSIKRRLLTLFQVNAQPWPYLKVEPRKYKFRLLDASISRTYSLYLTADNNPATRLPFTVVGADAGYLDHPVPTSSLVIAMAERYEIVIDFAQFKGQNLTLGNERNFQTNPDFPATDRVLRFVVGDTVTDPSNNGPLPGHLSDLAIPAQHPTVDHEFTFERSNGQWLINGVGFEDVANRILAKPKRGQVERWRLINKSGGWSHPIHIHLIDFQVVSRAGGRGSVMPYEAAALKDVVYLGTNEQVEVIANYAPWGGMSSLSSSLMSFTNSEPGVYMFHCHNLVHEDHDMMGAFNVSSIDLKPFGYDDKVILEDPMTPLFRAKPYTGTDLNTVKGVTLPAFDQLNAYPDAKIVDAALASFYAAAAATPAPAGAAPAAGTATTLATSVKASSTKTSTAAAPTATVARRGRRAARME